MRGIYCAQVGINIMEPQASFDIIGWVSNTSRLDGKIVSMLAGVQLKS